MIVTLSLFNNLCEYDEKVAPGYLFFIPNLGWYNDEKVGWRYLFFI
ncbi:hypothetical protein [Streptococcus loxodontisalivarius]|uniref:Uncharacterized protein n=1 Tax=Streptococcus loxodontisalivarius TaxID=1349415 RepID=A0ABS2PVC1_9STRE|nr:hypothetical protein [Streptococcus loxodontisalivarius]MBM7643237.1 hypothetical protein [Streptococcus loxodontisalivarius]